MKQDMRTSEQEGFIAELAIKLAEFDGLDEDSMFQLQWSGGSAPEPLGDAFSMDYLPRAEQLFLVIQQHSQQEINKYKSYYDAVLDHCAISHLPEKETPYQTIGSLCDFHSEIALDPRVSPEALAKQQELDAARLEVERLRDLIGLSYGYLWHVNNEHGTPQRFYPPERAAYEARKLLRDTLTHEQRGQYINSVRELIDEALAAQPARIARPVRNEMTNEVERVVRYTMPYSLIVCGFEHGIPEAIQMRIHLNKQGFEFEDDGKPSSAINKNPIPVGVLEWSDNEFGRTFVQRIPCT